MQRILAVHGIYSVANQGCVRRSRDTSANLRPAFSCYDIGLRNIIIHMTQFLTVYLHNITQHPQLFYNICRKRSYRYSILV